MPTVKWRRSIAAPSPAAIPARSQTQPGIARDQNGGGQRRGCQKREPGILLYEKRNDENDPREKCAKRRKTLAFQLEKQKDAAQDDEGAVGVVERMRKDAVDPQRRERRGQEKRRQTK